VSLEKVFPIVSPDILIGKLQSEWIPGGESRGLEDGTRICLDICVHYVALAFPDAEAKG